MPGLDFSHLLDGIKHGTERGLQYSVEEAQFLLKALQSGNPQMMADAEEILTTFLHEVADNAGVLKGNVLPLMLGGGDPTASSRHKLQAAEVKWGLKPSKKTG